MLLLTMDRSARPPKPPPSTPATVRCRPVALPLLPLRAPVPVVIPVGPDRSRAAFRARLRAAVRVFLVFFFLPAMDRSRPPRPLPSTPATVRPRPVCPPAPRPHALGNSPHPVLPAPVPVTLPPAPDRSPAARFARLMAARRARVAAARAAATTTTHPFLPPVVIPVGPDNSRAAFLARLRAATRARVAARGR
ncbi:hypothetical protein HDU90_008578 [Geranomyces variabilis]|nr:hypothetical protein HDU90_008578 [Geranomyces variabilis]